MFSFKEYFIINEAIPLKQVKKKKLTRGNGGAYKIEQLNTIFKGKDRLVYDIDIFSKDILTLEFPILEKILEILKEKLPDYTIPTKNSYIQGFVYKKEDTALKRPFKIGKVLSKYQNDPKVSDVLNSFIHDPMRASTKNKKLKVVISRHPYDIAGMSTDRSWTSCMNMGTKGVNYPSKSEGINRRFVSNDISSGTIIAYLVSDDDRHQNGKLAIKRPIARLLLKPYIDTKDVDNHAYSVERVYGTPNESFVDFVRNWVDNNINKNVENKRFVLHDGLYFDGEPYKNFVGVRKEIEDMSNVFFSNLYRTPEKYFRNFIINTENDGFNTEIIIEFSFDKSVKMENRTFESSNKLPQYVKDIKDATEIEEKNSYYGSQGVIFTRMEMHPEQDNLLRIEYVFRIPDIREDHDEKDQYDDPYIKDHIHETFELFMRECNFDDFDYGKSYKRIKDILLNANPENEKEQEIQELTNKFKLVSDVNNPNSPIHRKSNEYNEYVKSLEKYVNAVSNLEKLELIFDEKYTPDQVDTKIREYWNPNSVFVKSLNDIKKFKDEYQVIYKAMNAYQPSQSDFANINIHNEWDKKIFQETMKISIDEIKNKLAKLKQTLMNTVTFIRLIRKHEESPELADIMFNVKSFQNHFDPYFSFYVSRW
jgi:hypothetical protein